MTLSNLPKSSVAPRIDGTPFFSNSLLKSLFLLTGLLCGFVGSGWAQTTTSLNVATQDFKILSPAGTLQAGESATYYIKLGSAAKPVSDAVAFDIELTLGAAAALPAPGKTSLSHCWIMAPTAANSRELASPAKHTLRLRAERTDGLGQTGYGELFRIELTSTVNGIPAEKLISSGGGLIIVEDIGYKRNPSALASNLPAPTLYPNPCAGQLRMDWHGEVPSQILLIDGQGKTQVIPQTALYAGSWNTENVAEGLYRLAIQYPNGEAVIRSLVIQ